MIVEMKDDKMMVLLDQQRPLIDTTQGNLTLAERKSLIISSQRSPLLDRPREIDLNNEDQYRAYLDKEASKQKLKIISEDFIDDLITKRSSMQQPHGPFLDRA